ncbi:hypothetical protein J9303_14775 [Bacillaceae bacterium Marseille-Q3522]|nr:hypothetical protein [Bacillaceae bacterium Marseille-Q3522]
MKVNLTNRNEGFLSLIQNSFQVLPLDANILIPSDRSKVISNAKLEFDFYKRIWLDPLFKTFPYIAIHQAVYEEISVTINLSKSKINYITIGQ